VRIIPQGGTALAEAIAATRGAFKAGNDNHKVLVLFTDGEDHDGNALEAARQAGKDGLRIFTIGVGTANGELLRTVDVQGRTEFIKDPDGNAVKSRLNEALLRDMAREAGGFFMLLSGANTMNLLYQRGLAPLPKSELASQRIKRPHERYQWFLGLAIVLLLVEIFLPERKPEAKASQPSYATLAVSKAALWAALALWPGLAAGSAGDGLKAYQRGRFDRALSEYERLLQNKPDDPRLHFNAGAAAFQNKDYDQALTHLNNALVTEDLSLQQRAYYNIGNTQFRQGEDGSDLEKRQQLWEQAIRSYDSALKLDPKDADADFNRELVKKKLEELKQQQQQQKQPQPQDKDGKDDPKGQSKQDQQQQKDQQQSKDSQSKEQQGQQKQDKDQQSRPQQQQQQDQQDQSSQPQQPKPAQTRPQDKKQGEEKKGTSGEQQQGEEGEPGEGQPQGRAVRMTPQQAIQLLEAMKGEEKVMTFRPILKTNRQQRVFKDW